MSNTKQTQTATVSLNDFAMRCKLFIEEYNETLAEGGNLTMTTESMMNFFEPIFNMTARRSESSTPIKKHASASGVNPFRDSPVFGALPKKHNVSSYSVFCFRQRYLVPQETPFALRSKKLSEKWKSMTTEEKCEYYLTDLEQKELKRCSHVIKSKKHGNKICNKLILNDIKDIIDSNETKCLQHRRKKHHASPTLDVRSSSPARSIANNGDDRRRFASADDGVMEHKESVVPNPKKQPRAFRNMLNAENNRRRDCQGNTMLMLAVEGCNLARVKSLIKGGSDVNAQNNIGYTALIIATLNCRLDCVKLLLDNGADTTIKTLDGMTAVDIAVSMNLTEIQQLFIAFSGEK